MKNYLFILLLYILPICTFSQVDSIMTEIINSDYPKPELIKKFSQLILYGIRIRDYEEAKKVKDYLISDVEDSNYVAIDEFNYPLILYWIHDYNGLLDYFRHFDSLQIANSGKIKPNNLDLYLELAWSIPEAGAFMIDSINKSDLKNEFKEVLKLSLYRLMIDVDYEMSYRELNFRASRFMFTHPGSEFNEYVRSQVKHDTPALVGISFEFLSGYGMFTNELHSYFRNNLAFGPEFDFFYNRFSLSLRGYVAQSKTIQNIPYSRGIWTKGSRADTFIPQAFLGYTVKNRYNRFINFEPFLGIGATEISPCSSDLEKFPDLKYAGLDYTLTYSIGLNVDLNLDYLLYIDEQEFPNISLRLRYCYNQMQFDKTYDGFRGNMHYLTLSIGFFEKRYQKIRSQ
jgi:hypothetical protein